jgi:hypothetical protein
MKIDVYAFLLLSKHIDNACLLIVKVTVDNICLASSVVDC